MRKYLKKAEKLGVSWVRLIHPKEVVVSEWVRLKCQYGCGAYGTCLTCPPYSPTPEYTRQMLGHYSKALIMIYECPPEARKRGLHRKMRKQVAGLERGIFLDGHHKAFAMACGPCGLCASCDVTQPCRHQEIARPSMEACGIDVYATLANSGYRLKVVTSPEDTCHFCALVLVD